MNFGLQEREPMARKSPSDRQLQAGLDKALRGLWNRLHARAVPNRLTGVVDQLAAAEQEPLRKSS